MKYTLLSLCGAALLFTSCTLTTKSMREPYSRVEFEREDFELSSQFKASASSTRILFIDWSRLFKAEMATVSQDGASIVPDITSIPVVGSVAGKFLMDPTASYALYNLMNEHPGYDVVFYPSFTTTVNRPIGLGIFTKSTVEVTARLGKLK